MNTELVLGLQNGFLFARYFEILASLNSQLQLKPITEFNPIKDKGTELPDLIFVNEKWLGSYLAKLPRTDDSVRRTGFFEWVEKTKFGFEPKTTLEGLMRTALSSRKPDIDIRASAYVVGGNHLALGVITTIIRMGFSRLIWVSESLDFCKSKTAFLSENYFGCNVIPCKPQELLAKENNGSLLVNCWQGKEDSPVLEDIAYLNFLSGKGLVVDFFTSPKKSRVLIEAKEFGIQHIGWDELGLIWGELWLRSSTKFAGLKQPTREQLEPS